MANQSAVFSWHNWIFEAVSSSGTFIGVFESEAPVTNMTLPQLGKLAIVTSTTVNDFFFVFGDSDFNRPVHIVGLLNTNIVELEENTSDSGLVIQLNDNTGAGAPIDVPAIVVPSGVNDFQNHLFWFVPADIGIDYERCVSMSVTVFQNTGAAKCGTKDPYTGEFTEAPFQCGGVWAGPIWRPPNGVKMRSWVQSVIEERRGPRSIGGQRYPSVEPRQRSAQVELVLPEDEVLNLDQARGSLQQMASWCGLSRPLVMIPTDTSTDLIYAAGLYGYLDDAIAWSHIDNAINADGSVKRYHSATIQMTEAL